MPKVPAIVRTRSLRGGHYRAGLRHGAEPGDIPPGTVTEEQLARLRADPDLEVEVIDPPEDAPPPRKKKPGAAGDPAPDKADDAGDSAGDGEDFGFDEDPEPAPEAKGK